MRHFYALFLFAVFIASPAALRADVLVQTISGFCTGGEPVSVKVTIDFTPTGGDFNAGTGTATVSFTVVNTTPVIPFQNPAIGNPIVTQLYFNVPPGASVTYVETRVLAGAARVSTGTTMLGQFIPPGCIILGADQIRTGWYELTAGVSGGQYGFFTNSLEPLNGVKSGIVNPAVYPGCVAQGDVFSPLVYAGPVKFTVNISNLDTSLQSAAGFLGQCSIVPGDQQATALAAKFQGTGQDGEDSCRIGEPCKTVPTQDTSWGRIKSVYE